MSKSDRFRWTRRRYKHAHQLTRLLSTFYNMPSDPPEIVRRYFELWQQYPQFEDPLLTPLQWRFARDIPF